MSFGYVAVKLSLREQRGFYLQIYFNISENKLLSKTNRKH